MTGAHEEPEALEALDPILAEKLAANIEREFHKSPPTIAVIGLSGVGKSSTINALFGTNRDVSPTTRGTSRFHKRNFEVISNRVYGTSLNCSLRIIDAPGLGEDVSLDPNYLKRYRQHLPEADIALWVIAARNRAIALDQSYLSELADVLPKVVLGINQVDLIDPLTWNDSINLPSTKQLENLKMIAKDRQQKLSDVLGEELPVVPYSATRFFNLQALFKACLDSAPNSRRWMFEILKSFSTRDWLAQAKGLSERQREKLISKYVESDQPISLGEFQEHT